MTIEREWSFVINLNDYDHDVLLSKIDTDIFKIDAILHSMERWYYDTGSHKLRITKNDNGFIYDKKTKLFEKRYDNLVYKISREETISVFDIKKEYKHKFRSMRYFNVSLEYGVWRFGITKKNKLRCEFEIKDKYNEEIMNEILGHVIQIKKLLNDTLNVYISES